MDLYQNLIDPEYRWQLGENRHSGIFGCLSTQLVIKTILKKYAGSSFLNL
ncbi:hypothetical protein SAMN05444412_1263 [Rhodonellum ikkaensis]|uniref:Uncharacterized protein n=1 Tax=Rhodonellum ikkaensis TaxID=336829 RepID=A0A1H3U288_9BACT|nr:hypothetical protein SAMN05444412_1263 [Rhodonellum ikkaensis]